MNVIYTAIFGPYEELKTPTVVTPGWNYICYTDQPFESDVWKIVKIITNRPVEMARVFKLVYAWDHFPEKSIWVDGSMTINCNLDEFWDNKFTSPMTVIQHPMRNCVYEEAATCIRNNRGNPADVAHQIEVYKAEGLPPNKGLIQSGIIMRENTSEVQEFCKLWWEQIKLSTRDQIGFAYAEWKTGKYWPRIHQNYLTATNFIFKPHYKRSKNVRTHFNNQ